MTSPDERRRSRATHRRVDLGGRITLGWLSHRGTVPIDIDQLDEFLLEEVPALDDAVPAPGSVLTVRVDLSLIEQHLTTLTGRPPATPIRFQTGVHPVKAHVHRWLGKLDDLITSLERDPALAAEPWLRAEVEGWWIVTGLLYALPHNHTDVLPPEPAGSRLAFPGSGSHPDDESIGALIARRRHELGLSQSKLAQLLAEASGTPSITRGRVSDYEHEKHIPDDWLEYLSIVLEIPLTELDDAAQLARARRHHR